jgi:hypothetical protein
MSDQPRMAWTGITPRLLGVAALAAFFLACLKGYGAPESPVQRTAGRLWIGMTGPEAYAATTDLEGPGGVRFNLMDCRLYFRDPQRDETLELDFTDQRLTKWTIRR